MTEPQNTWDSEFYYEHGYFHLRPDNAAFLQNIEKAAQSCDELLADPSHGGLNTAFKNKDGKNRHLLFVHLAKDVFLNIMRSEEVKNIVQAVFGEQRVFVTHSKLSYKEVGEDLPWYPHQDNGYKELVGVPLRMGMTLGVFLEDADERNGTLQLFPDSQKLKTLPHVFKKENDDDLSGQAVLEKLPENLEPMSIIARKGDIVSFSLDMIHQSQSNRSHGYRPLLIFEVEPFEGAASDEYGNPPLIINGEMSFGERMKCRLNGISKKIRLGIGKSQTLKKLYRQFKYGASKTA